MKIFDHIPDMDELALRQLEENARRKTGDPQAKAVLTAIEAERTKRRDRVAAASATHAEHLAARVQNLDLVQRIAAAFTELPPSDAELRRLRLLHEHPNRNEYELAVLSGDKGPGGFNLVIGNLCFERRHYLPKPDIARARGEPFWSGLVCVLSHRTDEGAVGTQGWSLRPETVLALNQLGYLPPHQK